MNVHSYTHINVKLNQLLLYEQGTGDVCKGTVQYMGLIFRQNKKWNIAVPPPPLLCVATLTTAAVSLFASPAIPTRNSCRNSTSHQVSWHSHAGRERKSYRYSRCPVGNDQFKWFLHRVFLVHAM